MSNVFENIPIRSNADSTDYVDAGWWNVIRTALLSAFPGLATSGATPLTVANNQTADTNFTGLILDKDTYTAYKMEYRIKRSDGTTDRAEVGYITATYKSAWSYSRRIDHGDDALNSGSDSIAVDSSTGQLTYKSDNMPGGTYSGSFDYVIVRAYDA